MKTKFLKRLIATALIVFVSMGALADSVWIDVRSLPEYMIDNIQGDSRISHQQIVEGLEGKISDKSTPIRLYCRSGGRAEKALVALKNAGYTDVKNVGSIDQARKERGIGL